MCIDGVGGAAPGLDLLGNALSVGRCEDAEFGTVAEVVGQVVEQGGYSLGNANWGEDAGTKEGVAAKTVVESIFRAGDVRMNPGHVGELFESESTHGPFITFPHPFQRQMVARGVKRIGGRESVETAFGEAPQEGIGFQVEGGAFAISLRPGFRPPDNVKTAVFVVSDGVWLVRAGKENDGFLGGVGNHGELFASR